MAKDSNDHWADACWWAGFRSGYGACFLMDTLTGLGLYLWWRWVQGP